MRILVDTGNNKYSQVLSERIEINLIQHYDTFRYGSNRCVDVQKVFSEKILAHPKSNSTQKSRKSRKLKKEWNQISSIILNNPFVSLDELICETGLSKSRLDTIAKNFAGVSLKSFISDVKTMWVKKYDDLSNEEKLKHIQINW